MTGSTVTAFTKVVNEILDHGDVADGEVTELHPAASHGQLIPGAVRQFDIIDHLALHSVDMDEAAVAAEYFYFGIILFELFGRQVANTQTSQTDINDLPEVHELVGPEKCRKSTLFASESLVFSVFFWHVGSILERG